MNKKTSTITMFSAGVAVAITAMGVISVYAQTSAYYAAWQAARADALSQPLPGQSAAPAQSTVQTQEISDTLQFETGAASAPPSETIAPQTVGNLPSFSVSEFQNPLTTQGATEQVVGALPSPAELLTQNYFSVSAGNAPQPPSTPANVPAVNGVVQETVNTTLELESAAAPAPEAQEITGTLQFVPLQPSGNNQSGGGAGGGGNVVCPQFVQRCPDGSVVGPDPENNCAVPACPGEGGVNNPPNEHGGEATYDFGNAFNGLPTSLAENGLHVSNAGRDAQIGGDAVDIEPDANSIDEPDDGTNGVAQLSPLELNLERLQATSPIYVSVWGGRNNGSWSVLTFNWPVIIPANQLVPVLLNSISTQGYDWIRVAVSGTPLENTPDHRSGRGLFDGGQVEDYRVPPPRYTPPPIRPPIPPPAHPPGPGAGGFGGAK